MRRWARICVVFGLAGGLTATGFACASFSAAPDGPDATITTGPDVVAPDVVVSDVADAAPQDARVLVFFDDFEGDDGCAAWSSANSRVESTRPVSGTKACKFCVNAQVKSVSRFFDGNDGTYRATVWIRTSTENGDPLDTNVTTKLSVQQTDGGSVVVAKTTGTSDPWLQVPLELVSPAAAEGGIAYVSLAFSNPDAGGEAGTCVAFDAIQLVLDPVQ